jgi:hypothetical protein
MPLMNYTARVSSDNTMSEVPKRLAAHGATAILSEYVAKAHKIGLSFKVRTG